jgi:hypothetical protein
MPPLIFKKDCESNRCPATITNSPGFLTLYLAFAGTLFSFCITDQILPAMKKLIQWIGCTTLLFSALSSGAQADNINNRYGPPTYTGGTIASPTENFALYHQARSNERIVERASIGIMEMYPNPATNFTRIVLDGSSTEPVTLFIVNMNGIIVKSHQYGAGSTVLDIDVSAFPAGIYAMQVQERGKEAQSIQLSKY